MKPCSRLFERLWRVEPDKEHAPCVRRFTVGAFANIGSSDQVSSQRRFEQLIGNSPALEAVLEQAEPVAPMDSTVLIQGETGTGKELIARAIHNIRSRRGRPSITLNCTAIPLAFLAIELFGYAQAASTAAIAQRL